MDKVPKIIKSQFDKLREQSTSRIYLKSINHRFYVYKESGFWDKERKRTKINSEYLGRILEDGTYVRRLASYKDELEKAKSLIALHGGKILWEEKKEDAVSLQQNTEISATEVDLKLLTALSMNARLSASRLAEISGVNEQTAYSRVKTLENKLGVKYLLELDVSKLGYTPYIILIKFEGKMPTTEGLRKALSNEPKIQFVAATKGDYDVVAYMLDESVGKALDNFRNILFNTELGKYGARWNVMPFATVYSFMPLRDEFIDKILKGREWKRTREHPTPKQEELMQRELLVLRELNNNSNESLSKIDVKYGLDAGTTRYAYQTLKNQEIIVRSTITMANLPIKYTGIILVANIYEQKVKENRHKLLFDIMEYGDVSNKYSLMGNIGMPDGAIMFMPVLNEGDIDKAAVRIERELQGSVVRSLVVTDVLFGSFAYRRFDNDYSRQYNLLVEFRKLEPKRPTNYE